MIEQIDRRFFIGVLGAAGAAAALTGRAAAFAPAAQPSFVMWHSPGCGCCLQWAKRMEAAFGRKLPVIETDNIAAVKSARGVPQDLHSCHTALVHGYAVEGHVPPADILRLVKSRSRIVRGLAVPGMPAGSPGMDIGHNVKQPYQVFAFGARGKKSVFASYR
jgi:hypothetical protein